MSSPLPTFGCQGRQVSPPPPLSPQPAPGGYEGAVKLGSVLLAKQQRAWGLATAQALGWQPMHRARPQDKQPAHRLSSLLSSQLMGDYPLDEVWLVAGGLQAVLPADGLKLPLVHLPAQLELSLGHGGWRPDL